jgi:hypothetical protein
VTSQEDIVQDDERRASVCGEMFFS